MTIQLKCGGNTLTDLMFKSFIIINGKRMTKFALYFAVIAKNNSNKNHGKLPFFGIITLS